MGYKIKLTKAALRDLKVVLTYISDKLKNKKASMELRNLFYVEVSKLKDNPRVYQRVNIIESEEDIRYLRVKNYLVFYLIDEESKTIYILEFLYGKRNWVEIVVEVVKEQRNE